ncbi:MAG TPA: endo-1,4-beta-xylanase [Paenibacillus sp.]|jgi:endo-1,4-beta-xylanase
MRKMIKQAIMGLLTAILIIPSGCITSGVKADTEGASGPVVVYHEDFTGGKGAATQSGGANLEHVTDKNFDGNEDGGALYVSNRSNNWDAADFNFANIGLKNGNTYTVTVTGYVDVGVDVPSDAQAYLQMVDSYAWLDGTNFKAGEAFTLSKKFIVDTSKDRALRVQSNDPGAKVPFYIGDILITEESSDTGPEQPRPPAKEFTTITFEDQSTGGFVGRSGSEKLTITNEDNHTGNGSYALKVEGRTATWHGPSLRVEEYVDKGSEYKISAWVKLIEPASSQIQLSTQIGNGGSANYVALAPKTINTSNGWVQFEGTYRYNSVGDEYLTIYIESSNNATASFYIDDISFVKVSGSIDIQRDLNPIKEAYKNDFLIGNAISAEDLDGIRFDLLTMHHNVATAGNAMKPDALQPKKGEFTFTAADDMVDKVLAAGMKMHGHVLVWHQQSPPWMNTTTDSQGNTISLSRNEALENMQTHIKTVVEHFGDKVISWDVVNEAMNDNPGNPSDWKNALRKSPWYQAIGDDYIEQAFLAARKAVDDNKLDIKLYYNDYNDDNPNKAEAIYQMVKELNNNYAKTHPGKLLIDGIGMQGHYSVNTNPASVEASLVKFISLGVEISITELDIQAGSNYQLPDNLATAQGLLYAKLFNIYKAHADHIKRVTFWGLDDGTSWRSSTNPLLFDKNLQAKPAYSGVIDPDRFIGEHQTGETEANQSTAKYGTPVIDGAIDAIWNDAPEMPINRYQSAWQGATGVAKALWDDKNLYVLIQVSDSELDKSSTNAWEQDSVEVFVDENNAKTFVYQDDDGQYRVNFDNETSFNPTSIATGFKSATKVSGTNYTVEMKIPFKTITPANNTKIGFDAQINDAKNGSRQSVAAWNDTTGNGYQDTSVFGVLTLTGKSGNGGESTTIEVKDGVVTIKPAVKVNNGRAMSTISNDHLNQALKLADPTSSGKNKQIVIDLPKQADVLSYDVQLPTERLKGTEKFDLLMKTEHSTVQIPSNLLSNMKINAEYVSIRIGKGSADSLNTAVNEVTKRPILELSLVVDGKITPWKNNKAPVTVTIPYTPPTKKNGHLEPIAIWSLNDKGNPIPIPNYQYDAGTGTTVFQITEFSTIVAA